MGRLDGDIQVRQDGIVAYLTYMLISYRDPLPEHYLCPDNVDENYRH